MRMIVTSLVALALGGCASIVEGTTQQITLNTNPPGADCSLSRQGTKIGEVQNTPGSVLIKKTKYDMTIDCTKPGYQPTSYIDHSGVEGATVANILLGGGIGWAIDSASGADNKYETPVNLTLSQQPAPQAAQPSPQVVSGVAPGS